MGKQSLNGKAKGSKSCVILGLDDDKGVPGGRPPRVLSLLSSVLERKIQRNEKLLKASGRKDVITLFHGTRAPALSIRQYIDRIFKYSGCSPSCFVVAYIYLEKLLEQMDVLSNFAQRSPAYNYQRHVGCKRKLREEARSSDQVEYVDSEEAGPAKMEPVVPPQWQDTIAEPYKNHWQGKDGEPHKR
ncbi:hypothetical protein RJ639_021714 [Escallonia herrerae]|uniref:Uncharacterized protein n=1 Tax=Escallonia herrerae TaxID=1293975 RepID=A0AA88V5B8_9ASTE|nr:hypothetical protein RJ639_021714 [Escallonia herrerae]